MTNQTVKPNYSLGINTCLDLYEKLKSDSARLRENESYHEYDIYNFIVTAHHLNNEWISKDTVNRPRLATKKINNSPRMISMIMRALKDIANCNKHMHLGKDDELNKFLVEIREPEIRTYSTWFKRKPLPGIVVKEGYLNIGHIESMVMSYFNWVFDDQLPVDVIPPDILKFTEFWEKQFRV